MQNCAKQEAIIELIEITKYGLRVEIKHLGYIF